MSFIDKLQRKFDAKNTVRFSDIDPFQDVGSWISTGSPTLDLFLKTWGFPTGVIEVRGESQSGKTTVSLQAMKESIERMGERAVVTILSSERRDNLPYAVQMGLDVNRIIVHRVRSIEDVKNKIFKTVSNVGAALDEAFKEEGAGQGMRGEKLATYVKTQKEAFGKPHFLFVWDSLGQTPSAQEFNKSIENAEKGETGMSAMASAARSLGNALRNIKTLEDDHNITLLIINRGYEKIDGTPGKESYGGKAIKLIPTMRLELVRTQGVKVGEEEVGQITKVRTIKTDFDSPKREFDIEIGYGLGVVLSKSDIEFGIEQGILTKFGIAGAQFQVGNKVALKWGSRKELYKLYAERNPNLKLLIRQLTNKAHRMVEQARKDALNGVVPSNFSKSKSEEEE